MRARLRTYLIAGLLVVLPLSVTIIILIWLFQVLDNFLGRFLTPVLGSSIPGLGLVGLVILILGAGAIASNVLGRRLLSSVDTLIMRIPLARSIYATTKQMSDSLIGQRRTAFQRVVLVEWPRQGLYSVGFVTGETRGEAQEKTRERVMNVFIVTTPNPTTGFLALVPESQVIPLEMSVEEGLKLVMSGGIVTPASPRETAASVVRDTARKREPGVET